jgi:septum site-determining protein MinC
VFIVSVAVKSRISFRLLGRSYLAFALSPERPLDEWLAELDRWETKSPSFFSNRPIVLDLHNIAVTKEEAFEIVAHIESRDLRLIAVEGVNPEWLPARLAPLPGAAQPGGIFQPPEERKPVRPEPLKIVDAEPPEPAVPDCTALLIDYPVRSGQSIIFPHGDVTVVGSVASGAEIIAGGSIHVYGSLRGRAFAGTNGNASARIFCNKFDAEILVIDGLYKTADDFDPRLRGASVQARLNQDIMNIETMN